MKSDKDQPYNIFGLLKEALRAEGVRASHLNQNRPDVEGDQRERLQVALPIGKTIHLYIHKNKLLISSKAQWGAAKYAMDIANPANDPSTIVKMFTDMCKAQGDLITKCEKLW